MWPSPNQPCHRGHWTHEAKKEYFYPGCTSLTQWQLFFLPWHLHLVSRLRTSPQKKKKAVLFSDDTTQRRKGGFQHTAISIWPWGHSYHYNSLSWAPVLHALKVHPHPSDAEVKWYISLFLWRGLRAPPPPPCLSLSCHASDTKLLHTASPWLPLALSICLPSTWRTLQL